MNSNQKYFGGQTLGSLSTKDKWAKKSDYVPLSEREWDGKVIVMTQEPDTWHRNYGRLQGTKARSAGRKCGNGG